MNPERLKQAGIDYDCGVRRFLGRAQLYEKTLSRFLRDGTFQRICAAYEAGSMDQLFAGVHEFKGMCGNIAMPSLYQSSEALVHLLRGGTYTSEELQTLYDRLCGEYHAACAAILSALEGSQS